MGKREYMKRFAENNFAIAKKKLERHKQIVVLSKEQAGEFTCDKQIVVLSKEQAGEFTCDKPWIGISIDPFGNHPTINEENRMGLLCVQFGDVLDTTSPEWFEAYGDPITKETAHEIWDFVEEHWDNVDVIMVHCQAGASRSPAIAAAISECTGCEERSKFFNPPFVPNKFVYKTMINVAEGRHQSQ